MDRDFEPFEMGKLFDGIKRGKRIVSVNHEEGDTPLVSSQGSNNGVTGFVGNTEGVRRFGDCLSVANGGASAGQAYYHPYEFVGADHVTQCNRDEASEDDYLYMSVPISKALRGKYGFTHEIKDEVMCREKVLLPVDDCGDPDWEYMDEYSVSTRARLLEKYKQYVVKRISELECRDVPGLDEVEWGTFTTDDIFEIRPGKRLEKRNMVDGERPFIGASDSNNGVTAFVGNVNESLDSNVLGINYNGSVCEAFYHPYECVFSDDVKRLHLKHVEDREALLLFMGMAIHQQKGKYEYAYKFNEQRMKRQVIMLPVRVGGEPDYAYMEQYAMNMMKRKYEQYLAYLDGQGD